ncbi:MAG: DUF3108 domain-containing protein [Candidatus Aenigmatarchaeota archaeon]
MIRKGFVFLSILLTIAWLAILELSSPTRAAIDLPFGEGETLVFDVYWLNLYAGRAVMEVKGAVNMRGRDAIHIVGVAESSSKLSLIYTIKDRIETYIDVESLLPMKSVVVRKERKADLEKTVIFNRSSLIATEFITKGQTEKIKRYSIRPDVQDILSSFYFIRAKGIKPGLPITFPVYAGNKVWDIEISVTGEERLKTPDGEVDCYIIKPVAKYEGKIQDTGDVIIWITKDSHMVPVKMRSNIKVKIGPARIPLGSVTASLKEYRNGKKFTGKN